MLKRTLMATLALAAASLCTLATGAASAASLNGPLRIIVGYPAGGGLDTASRMLADEMRELSGQSVIVENRPGAASLLAAEYVARLKPDGTTVLVAPITVVAVHPFIFKDLKFDPANDLVPVAEMGIFHYGLAVNPSVTATNVREFIGWVKERPGKVSFASLGTGSFAQLLGLMFNQAVGTDMVEVPYKGSAPGLVDLRGGQVQASFDTTASLVEHHKAGAIRLLAVTGGERSPLLPDVPTFRESNLNMGEIERAEFWYGVFAPKGTPKGVVDALNEAINEALKKPRLRQRLQGIDVSPRPKSADAFQAQARADNALWGKVIREAGSQLAPK